MGASLCVVSFPHLNLAANAHDRTAVRRVDEQWLDEHWADPESRVVLISGSRIRPVDGAVEWLSPVELPTHLTGELSREDLDGRRILLGERDGRTWFALLVDGLIDVDSEEGDRSPSEWLGLRDLLMSAAANLTPDAPLVFHAVGLAEWRLATRFCPRCGGVLDARAAGHELVCRQCGRVQFPRTDPAVIMTITHGEPGADDEAILLGRQAAWPAGRFSTLAGFVEPGESLEDAVRREVFEEVGVTVAEVEYFGNQAWPFPASLMLGLIGRATTRDLVVDQVEIEEARWFTRAELLAESQAGSVLIPRGISISSSLVQHWFGDALPGTW